MDLENFYKENILIINFLWLKLIKFKGNMKNYMLKISYLLESIFTGS